MDNNWVCPKCFNTTYTKGPKYARLTIPKGDKPVYNLKKGLLYGLGGAIKGGIDHGVVGAVGGLAFGLLKVDVDAYAKYTHFVSDCRCSKCGFEFEIVD